MNSWMHEANDNIAERITGYCFNSSCKRCWVIELIALNSIGLLRIIIETIMIAFQHRLYTFVSQYWNVQMQKIRRSNVVLTSMAIYRPKGRILVQERKISNKYCTNQHSKYMPNRKANEEPVPTIGSCSAAPTPNECHTSARFRQSVVGVSDDAKRK